MRLPNGYGSISKLPGKRRRPYMIRKGGNIIGYAKTRKEGLEILADINRGMINPEKDMTFKEVYDLLVKVRFPQLSDGTCRKYRGKFNLCEPLHNKSYQSLRQGDFLAILDQSKTPEARRKTLQFLRAMDKVAFDFDVIVKQYTQTIPNPKAQPVSKRQPFSEEEIKTLWDNLDVQDVDLILILIYTGFRSGEFADLKIENIDLDRGTITGGNKTEAGRNRIVPIHTRIRPLIENRLKAARRDTFLNYSGKQFRIRFKKVMKALGMNHIPHECRHTFRTRLDNLDVNPNTINLLMGHAGAGVGERVYTHKTLNQLIEAVNLLK